MSDRLSCNSITSLSALGVRACAFSDLFLLAALVICARETYQLTTSDVVGDIFALDINMVTIV